MKKFLSIILTAMLIIGMLPTAFAVVDEATVLKYEFTLDGAGETGNETNTLLSSASTKQIATGMGNDVTETGDDWSYVVAYSDTSGAGYNFVSQLTPYGFWWYASAKSNRFLGKNGIAFKIEVTEEGVYVPKLNYLPYYFKGNVLVYLIDDSINGTKIDSSKYYDFETNAKNSLAYSVKAMTGQDYQVTEDMIFALDGEMIDAKSVPTSENVKSLFGEPIELSKGTYYLVITGYNINDGKRYMPYIASFELEEKPELEKAMYNVALATSTNIEPNEINVIGDEYTRGATATASTEQELTIGGTKYVFSHWVRGTEDSGEVVSKSASYSFSLMTNTYLTAIYTEETTAPTVEFYNGNKEYITAKTVKEDGKVDLPENPEMTGFVFSRWIVDKDTEFENKNITESAIVVAEFKDDESKKFTVAGETTTYCYDAEITRTVDGETEYAWYRNGNYVRYGASYIFNVWADVTSITYDQLTAKAPVVVLDEATKTDGDGNTAYMIEYDAGGKNIIEVGILFGTAESTPTIDSCMYKSTSQTNGGDDGHGQFTAKSANSEYATARGYMIYEDNGTYRVIYSK